MTFRARWCHAHNDVIEANNTINVQSCALKCAQQRPRQYASLESQSDLGCHSCYGPISMQNRVVDFAHFWQGNWYGWEDIRSISELLEGFFLEFLGFHGNAFQFWWNLVKGHLIDYICAKYQVSIFNSLAVKMSHVRVTDTSVLLIVNVWLKPCNPGQCCIWSLLRLLFYSAHYTDFEITNLCYYWINLLHTNVDSVRKKCLEDGTWFLYYDL